MSIKRVWRNRPLPDHYWVYDICLGGRRVRTPRGEYYRTKQECEDAVHAIHTDYHRDRYLFPADRSMLTITNLLEVWAARLKQVGRSPSYVRQASSALKILSEVIWPTSRLLDLRTFHLERYHARRLADGAKPQTVHREIVSIMSALNSASNLFESLSDWRPPKKPKNVTHSVSGRERLITREEEEKIIAALMNPRARESDYYARARKQLARLFWLALRTGMREGELLGLQRAGVNFERAIKMPNGWIDVRRSHGCEQTKTGRRRVVPMTPSVAQAIKQQIVETDSVYVFPSPLDLRSRWASFRIGFEKACRAAGVSYGRDVPDGLVFHDTRHTAATRMLQAGVDLKTVGAILGHSDQYMTMHYAHATAESRYAAVTSLGADNFFGVSFESAVQTDEAAPGHSRPNVSTA